MSVNNPVVRHQGPTWPPIVHIALGCLLLIFWLLGTSIQIATSEAWFTHVPLSHLPTLAILLQPWQWLHGQLPANMLAPVAFAFGVQMATVFASIGVELPRYPSWRFHAARLAIVGLIGINSAGDWQSTQQYGTWGQFGFTMVVLFLTFVVLFLAIHSFLAAFSKMN